jgi:rare lipoprotein A
MQHTLDNVASRRGGALRRALLALGLMAAGALPALADGRIAADGTASFYGREEHGGKTASGERFDMNAMTAAHRTAPLGSRLKVTNLRNGSSVVVRINDRGPFVRGRIIDLSRAAAAQLGFIGAGVTRVHIETADAGTPTGATSPTRVAEADPVTTGTVAEKPTKKATREAHARAEAGAKPTETAAKPAETGTIVLAERDRLLIERNGAAN